MANQWSGDWFQLEEWVRKLVPRNLEPLVYQEEEEGAEGEEGGEESGAAGDSGAEVPPAPNGDSGDEVPPVPNGDASEDGDEDGEDEDEDEDGEDEDEDEDEDGEDEDEDEDGDEDEDDEPIDMAPLGDDGEDAYDGVDPRLPVAIRFSAGARFFLKPVPNEEIKVLEYETEDLVALVRERVSRVIEQSANGRKQLSVRLEPMSLDENAEMVPWAGAEPLVCAFTDTSRPTPAPPPPVNTPVAQPAVPVPAGMPMTPAAPEQHLSVPPAYQPTPVREAPSVVSHGDVAAMAANMTNAFMGHIGALIGTVQEMARESTSQAAQDRRMAQEREAEMRRENQTILNRVVEVQALQSRVEAESRVSVAKFERDVEAQERKRALTEAQARQEQLAALQRDHSALMKKLQASEAAGSATSDELKAQLAQTAMAMMQQLGEYVLAPKTSESEVHTEPAAKPQAAPPPPAAPAPAPARAAPIPGAPKIKSTMSGSGPAPAGATGWAASFAKMSPEEQRAAMQEIAAALPPDRVGHLAENMVDAADARRGGQ